VISAIYLFLRYRERYADALIEVLNAGGDTDSVGAVVGALCGAAGGEEAIPDAWLEGLRALEQIRLRADALAGEPYKQHRIRPLAEFELELTLEEDRARREHFPPGTFPEAYEWEEPPHEPLPPPRDEAEPSAASPRPEGRPPFRRRSRRRGRG
jgi:hypothetical protein